MKTTYTTYPTVKEAFAAGSGDVFFKNESGFLAESRHSADIDAMKALGFEHVPHLKVLEIAAEQSPAASVQPVKVETAPAPKKIKFVSYSDLEVDGFYDEFPDAYNQNL